MSETPIDSTSESRPVDQDVAQPVMPKTEDVPRASTPVETQPVETPTATATEDAPMHDGSTTVRESTSDDTVGTAPSGGIKRQSSHDSHDNEEDRAVKRVKEDHPVCALLIIPVQTKLTVIRTGCHRGQSHQRRLGQRSSRSGRVTFAPSSAGKRQLGRQPTACNVARLTFIAASTADARGRNASSGNPSAKSSAFDRLPTASQRCRASYLCSR